MQIGKDLSAKLDYRSGYFATKEFKKFDSSDEERQLEQALPLGDPVTDLTLALETDYFRLAERPLQVPVSIKIPGTDIELAKQGQRRRPRRIDFMAEVQGCQRRAGADHSRLIQVKLSEETAAELAKKQRGL